MRGGRGQSAPLSTLLMVALTLVVVVAAGLVVFDATPDLLGSAPSATVDVSAEGNGEDAQTLVVAHRGGDDFRIAAFDVLVRDGSTTTRLSLSAFENRSGTSGGTADAGDTIRTTRLLSGPTTVQLVHRPTDSIVVEERVTLPSDDGPSIVDFEAADPSQSFESGQDGTGSTIVDDGGATVTMAGNQWKYVERSYEVTENTTLVFEFNSSAEGEIHGIGLEDDQDQTGDRIVEVFGTQGWGKNVADFDGLERYQLGDGWVRYEVPVGEHYESENFERSTQYLVFVMDCDDGASCPPTDDGSATANSRFRNVRIYENDSSSSLAPVSVA